MQNKKANLAQMKMRETKLRARIRRLVKEIAPELVIESVEVKRMVSKERITPPATKYVGVWKP